MPYPAVIQRALDALRDVPLPESTKAPPLHRLLWRRGVALPPPLLAGVATNFALLGGFFGVTWGTAMTLLFTPFVAVFGDGRSAPWLVLAGGALSAGLLFGGFMAAYFAHQARKHGLPTWTTVRDAA